MPAPVSGGKMGSIPPRDERNLTLRLKSGNTINLEKGDFNGSVSKAMTYLQDFCNHAKNTVTIESFGHGYGKLTVNDQKHDITPYGIDIKMMLNFCGGKSPEDF